MKYNSIPKQNKTGSDRITPSEWNAFINILAIQTNNNTKFISELISGVKTDDLKEYVDNTLKDFENRLINIPSETYKTVDNLESDSFFLNDKTDLTLKNSIKSIGLDITKNTKHGFYSSINFKTTNSNNELYISNNSNFDLKIIKYGLELNEIELMDSKTYNLVFYCDGLYVYCYYQVI